MLAHVDPSGATKAEKVEKTGRAQNTVKRGGFWRQVVGGVGVVVVVVAAVVVAVVVVGVVVVVAVVVVVVVVVVVGNPGPEQRDRATAVHGRLSPRWPVVRGHTAPHTWGQRPGRRV